MEGLQTSIVRVVIVDDFVRIRQLFRKALESHGGFCVEAEAGDGHEAIDVVRRVQPDIVLMDLSMPRMDGLEALVKVKAVAPGARVVVLSGFMRDRVEALVMSLGANAYLEKGLAPRALAQRLAEVARQPPRAAALVRHDELLARIEQLV